MALFDALDSDLDDIAARCTDDDAGVRRVAMLELAEVTDLGAVPLLVKGLGDADPAVREAAAKALDEHSGEGIVSALVNALEDPVAAVRVAAAETLAEKKDPESVALLIARVDHPEPFVRAAALRTVRELVTPEALPAALRALKDQSPEVRREAIGVLGYLKADQALPALMAAAGDTDPSVRRAVMSALVFTRPGGPGAAALLGGLADTQWQVREQAAASIGKVRLPEAIGPLIATMNDESWQVRAKAANALGRICASPPSRRWARRFHTRSATCAKRRRPRSARSRARRRWCSWNRLPGIRTLTCASSCAGPSAAARRRCSVHASRGIRHGVPWRVAGAIFLPYESSRPADLAGGDSMTYQQFRIRLRTGTAYAPCAPTQHGASRCKTGPRLPSPFCRSRRVSRSHRAETMLKPSFWSKAGPSSADHHPCWHGSTRVSANWC